MFLKAAFVVHFRIAAGTVLNVRTSAISQGVFLTANPTERAAMDLAVAHSMKNDGCVCRWMDPRKAKHVTTVFALVVSPALVWVGGAKFVRQAAYRRRVTNVMVDFV